MKKFCLTILGVATFMVTAYLESDFDKTENVLQTMPETAFYEIQDHLMVELDRMPTRQEIATYYTENYDRPDK